MYNLLLVDDEWFAIEGLKSGVDWQGLKFGAIYEAHNAEQAKLILQQTAIDVMVCDIEMPGGNGISLMEWVKEQQLTLETIFLTCHADFKYAQRAVHLGSFDYLLKPVDYRELQDTVHNALEKVAAAHDAKQRSEAYEKVYSKWEMSKNVLFERFWQDLFWQRLLPTPGNIERALTENLMPLSPEARVLPILIGIEHWGKPLNTREEEMMEFALRNAASEMLLGGLPGQVLQDGSGVQFALFFDDPSSGNRKPQYDEIKRSCTSYIDACAAYLYCHLSCYIGDWVPLSDVSRLYNALIQMEHHNVTRSQSVLFFKEQPLEARETRLPALFQWSELLEHGKREELLLLADDVFADLRKDTNVTSETLRAFYHALLQTIYYVLHRRGISVVTVFPGGGLLDEASATRSLHALQERTQSMIETVTMHMSLLDTESTVVDKVKRYINDHLFDDLSREELAAFAHINSAYLSRLFKKEAGVSLTDFIVEERMKKAKDMLLYSEESVSNIAKAFHYTNFSHFSKLFRKYYGMNPQEYRRQFTEE
ncbi:helix-turn-helix domain-containing protein [Paenibacillus sp. CF384]|uniref:response regulator transcription factor n=1 Tax=Paenibacillus sp. CF384 TaxID=1884382 RepID=UPI0008993E6A|nr:helix-turn-helix domain-containing protein [Paenibacillus sp. CF384]SDW88887.1 two-component system, response regulator YesN [Paenibacillus sp. CF384]